MPREEGGQSPSELHSHREYTAWPNEKLAINIFDSLLPGETERMMRVEEYMRSGEWMMLSTADWTVTRFEGNLTKDRANTVDVSISLWDAIAGIAHKESFSADAIERMKEKYALLSHGCSGTRLKISFPIDGKEVTQAVKQTCQEKYAKAKRVGYFAHGWTGGIETADIPGAEQANLWFRDLEKRGHGSEDAVYVRMVSLGMDEANFDEKSIKHLLQQGFGSQDYAHHFSVSKLLFGIGSKDALEELYGHSMGGAMLIYLSRVEEILGIEPRKRMSIVLAPAYDDKTKEGDPNLWTAPTFDLTFGGIVATATTTLERIGLVRGLSTAMKRAGGEGVFAVLSAPLIAHKLRSLFQAPLPTLATHAEALRRHKNLVAKEVCEQGGRNQRGAEVLLQNLNQGRGIFIAFEGDSLVSPEETVQEFIDADTPFTADSNLTPLLYVLPAKPFAESRAIPQFIDKHDTEAKDHYAFQYPEIKPDVDRLAHMMRLEEPFFSFFRLMTESYSRFRMILPEGSSWSEQARFGEFLQAMFLSEDSEFIRLLLNKVDATVSVSEFENVMKKLAKGEAQGDEINPTIAQILTILRVVGEYTQYLRIRNEREVIAETVRSFSYAQGGHVQAMEESSQNFQEVILARIVDERRMVERLLGAVRSL